MSSSIEDRLASIEPHQQRRLKTISQPQRPAITLENRAVSDFCHNDYLGLSTHPALIYAAQEALARYGTGTAGARLIGGTYDLHTQLEIALCAFKGTPAALVFNSGYQANVGVLSGLIQRHDTVFADKLNHASLVDGAILSRAKVNRYAHADMAALESQLQSTPKETIKWIVTDSVFSMDGDLAPLETLFNLAEDYDAWLIIDEAHGTGVFGDVHHSGLWETTGLGFQPRVIQIGTFSKALGSFGAYVAADKAVIQALLQFSRSFIYSTSLPPAVIAANLAAVQLIQEDPQPTQTLWDNIQHFQTASRPFESWLQPIQSPIIPVTVGDSALALQMTQTLLDQGFFVQAIRPPTVPQGTSRLRITLSASHTPQQIQQLAQALSSLLPQAIPAGQ